MLLLEEKLTDRLPCPTTEQVGRALAEGAPGMAPGLHVLMDLIEVAEALGAHAVHLLLDRRKHGTHSLLSPSLSAFQGEALCVYMPGVLLDKERLCRLQLPYDARTGTSKGGAAVAGAVPGTATEHNRVRQRLLGMYVLSEVACVVSGGSMVFFDPSGKYLPASVTGAVSSAPTGAVSSKYLPASVTGGGDASSAVSSASAGAVSSASSSAVSSASSGAVSSKDRGADSSAVGRAYPIVPGDLPQRFPDQFAPLGVFGFRPHAGKPLDGTLLRLPLRTHLLAVHSQLCTQFWRVPRVRSLVQSLQRHAPTLLLGLSHVDVVSAAEWPPTDEAPTRTLQVSLAPSSLDGLASRGALLKETSWRQVSLMGFFGAKQHKEGMLTLDVTIISRELERRGERELERPPPPPPPPPPPSRSATTVASGDQPTSRPSTESPTRELPTAHHDVPPATTRESPTAHPDAPPATAPATAALPSVVVGEADVVLLAVATGPAVEGAELVDGHVIHRDGEALGAHPLHASAQHSAFGRPGDAQPTGPLHASDHHSAFGGPGDAQPTGARAHHDALDGIVVDDDEDLDGIDDEQADEDDGAALLRCPEQLHTDRWLMCEVLAAGRTRTLALDGRFAARGAMPYAAVAAHLLHDGHVPQKPYGGELAAPLPLTLRTGLPVHVMGRFEMHPVRRAVPLTKPPSASDETSDRHPPSGDAGRASGRGELSRGRGDARRVESRAPWRRRERICVAAGPAPPPDAAPAARDHVPVLPDRQRRRNRGAPTNAAHAAVRRDGGLAPLPGAGTLMATEDLPCMRVLTTAPCCPSLWRSRAMSRTASVRRLGDCASSRKAFCSRAVSTRGSRRSCASTLPSSTCRSLSLST